MICKTCTASFNKAARNQHVPETYKNSARCLTCLIEHLQTKQNIIYPTLKRTIKNYASIKAAYRAVSTKVSSLKTKFATLDYDKHMIIHSIAMIEQTRLAKQAKAAKAAEKKATKSKATKATPEMIKSLLANLTKEQQESVMSNFLKS